MHFELKSQSKYRDGVRLGDDVPLIVPGQIYGVFDGATDPRGTIVGGIGTGRLAALTVAQLMTDMASTPGLRDIPAPQIVHHLTSGLATRTDPLALPIPPSTTLAIALDCGDEWRFMTLGDTGIRLNGTEVLRHEKLIDSVSTVARVCVFKRLQEREADPDVLEKSVRRVIFLGFDAAVREAVLDRAAADQIISQAIEANGLEADAASVVAFLNGGIQTQFRLGNATGSPLCFDTLNGTVPQLGHLIDMVRPKSDVQSIEIFSDGYPDFPEMAVMSEWEERFHRAEEVDFHKTGPFAAVKGSTSDEYFDDRTVLLLSGL
ncbi:hypothetical protein [Tateyamaria pelophila]|uniref:hypothetical protein n=1 Tax=Tateyamaria pelophila TaxID=328415 RepID=UPI001CBC6BED|nr:hypothetical protein [Tateyamaria pelophila]